MGAMQSKSSMAVMPSVKMVASKKKSKKNALTAKKYTRHELRLMHKYMPSFTYPDKSTQRHRDIAGAHWERVFSVAQPKKNSTSSQREAAQAPAAAGGRPTSSDSPIMVLYDTFFKYLEQHSPELQPIFRSSMQIRGKVLVHISIGMRTLMSSENFSDKVIPLTKTHRRFGVKLEHYEPLGLALMHAMHTVSGDRWSPEIEDAWKRLFSHTGIILIGAQERVDAHVAKAAAKPIGPNARLAFWTASKNGKPQKKSAVLPSVADLVPQIFLSRRNSNHESAFNATSVNGERSLVGETDGDAKHAVYSSVYNPR